MDIALNTIAPSTIGRARRAGPSTIGHLIQAALRSMRYGAHYRGVIRELGRMDAHMLKDIGIPPWELEAFAHTMARDKAAEGATLRQSIAALLDPVFRMVEPREQATSGLWR
jgi:uncharacterized protein YjiS (DUF1127 family)